MRESKIFKGIEMAQSTRDKMMTASASNATDACLSSASNATSAVIEEPADDNFQGLGTPWWGIKFEIEEAPVKKAVKPKDRWLEKRIKRPW